MSISDKFTSFCKNIRISEDDVYSIRYRYKQITKRLNKEYYFSDSDTNHSYYVGSYGRDTDIHVSDIDMIFVLPYSIYQKYNCYSNNGQSALLQDIKTSIQKTYSTTHLRADGQVVVISWTDGIVFEIVPVFVNTDNSYTYPDTNHGGSWKVTNPKPEIETIRDMNNSCNKNLKKLARMIRAWRDNVNLKMGGLLIDTLAYAFIKDYEYKDKSYLYYDWFTRDFFKYISEFEDSRQYWYAPGSNQLVYKKENFRYKAKQAYEHALQAIEYEKKKYQYLANKEWREIYGNKF